MPRVGSEEIRRYHDLRPSEFVTAYLSLVISPAVLQERAAVVQAAVSILPAILPARGQRKAGHASRR